MTFHLYWLGFWVRLGTDGPGLRIDWNAPMLWSERHGFSRPLVRLGKLRIERLRNWRNLDENARSAIEKALDDAEEP